MSANAFDLDSSKVLPLGKDLGLFQIVPCSLKRLLNASINDVIHDQVDMSRSFMLVQEVVYRVTQTLMYMFHLSDYKILYWSKLKAFADDN